MLRYLDKAAVTIADSSVRERAISLFNALLRDFGMIAFTIAIVGSILRKLSNNILSQHISTTDSVP